MHELDSAEAGEVGLRGSLLGMVAGATVGTWNGVSGTTVIVIE